MKKKKKMKKMKKKKLLLLSNSVNQYPMMKYRKHDLYIICVSEDNSRLLAVIQLIQLEFTC